MIRIHKVVEQILKDTSPQYSWEFEDDVAYFDEGVVEEWPIFVDFVMAQVMEDPTIDMLAADFGLDTDDLSFPPRTIVPNLAPDVGRQLYITFMLTKERRRTSGGSARRNGDITIYVPEMMVRDGSIDEVAETVIHEITHFMDNISGTGDPEGTAGLSFEDWLASPDEQEAIKSVLYSLLNGGYSEEETLGIMLEQYDRGWVQEAENPEQALITFRQFLERAIEEIVASGEVLIEEEPPDQLPLFPSEAIVI